ncbi:hypothetical protein [Methylobacterium sp.]|jgi:hypothetical protein|uniref:hypothetical protein n=1 Tax=Methylobacterium sp. TaxID=409 RepID=UPI00345882EC|nr:hypothetical protein [Methylobacterium sp.]
MMAHRLSASALAGAFLLIGAGLGGAMAAPAADQSPSKVSSATPAITPVAAVTESEDDAANCSRSRRRLWVEGEGWIVRRVTTCR